MDPCLFVGGLMPHFLLILLVGLLLCLVEFSLDLALDGDEQIAECMPTYLRSLWKSGWLKTLLT